MQEITKFLSIKYYKILMLGATINVFSSNTLASAVFSRVTLFGFEYCTVNFQIISFVVIIRIIRNVIVAGYVLVSETIIVRLVQCNSDCYCHYCCLLIVLN